MLKEYEGTTLKVGKFTVMVKAESQSPGAGLGPQGVLNQAELCSLALAGHTPWLSQAKGT